MKPAIVFAMIGLAAVVSGCNQQSAKKNQSTPVVQTTERGRGGGLRKACASELQQYCAGNERGRARRACLEGHASQLSDACKAALQARGERHGGRRRAF